MAIDGEPQSNPVASELTAPAEAPVPEQKPAPRIESILGFRIARRTDLSQKLIFDSAQKTVFVNPERYRNVAAAEVAAATMAMRQAELENMLRSEKPDDIKKIPKDELSAIGDIALWTSAARLRESEKRTLSEVLTDIPAANSYADEARLALFGYVATGTFPPVSEEIQSLLAKLPKNKQTGRIPLDALADGAVALTRKLEYYTKHVAPLIAQAKELDRQIEKTIGDAFQPSTENSEGEPLNEEDILQRVYPFFGGYYREQVFDGVSWDQMQVVATSRPAEQQLGIEVPDGQEVRRYEFKGQDGQRLASGPISLPLPANAELISNTLTTGLAIKRDSKGIYFLTFDERVPLSALPETYEFEFALRTSPPDFTREAPTEPEQSALAAESLFSSETQAELADLAKLGLSPTAIANRIVAKIHGEIEYVNSDEVGQALGAAGPDYFRVLETVKKADCDVSNFYLIAQLRSLSIPARMVAGYYITDRSFGYTPIAGTKHAWTEYYDQTLGEWKRIDATPPKRDDEEESDQDEEKSQGSGGDEMREERDDGLTSFEGDDDETGLELTDEQRAQFTEYVKAQFDQLTGEVQTSKLAAAEAFLKEHGVTPEAWKVITDYVERANQTKIPKDQTIEKTDDSTLGEQWEKFFNLFLVAYRIPEKRRTIQVRQSLGSDSSNPSETAIDLLAGSDDPYGYEITKPGEREIKLPIDFSNDYLLDLTASMGARDEYGQALKDYQKLFVMSALYHGFQLNQELKYHEGELPPDGMPFITNHLVSINGDNRYRELTSGEREITMTQLTELFHLLDKVEQGGGDMVGALRAYRDRLFANPEIAQKIKAGEMIKTLTILSDGNLWCKECGKESCSYAPSAKQIAQSRQLIQEVRAAGVIVNAVGFTENSRQALMLVDDTDKPNGAAVIATNIGEAVALHHGQMIRSWETIQKAAEHRQQNRL